MSEDCRAQSTQIESNNNLKIMTSWLCQFTWSLGITTACSLMKNEFQGKTGFSLQEHLYIMGYSYMNLSRGL